MFNKGDVVICIDDSSVLVYSECTHHHPIVKNQLYIKLNNLASYCDVIEDGNSWCNERFKKLEVGDIIKRHNSDVRWCIKGISGNVFIVNEVGGTGITHFYDYELVSYFTYCGAEATPVKCTCTYVPVKSACCPIHSVSSCRLKGNEKTNTPKEEPKFKVGDIVVCTENPLRQWIVTLENLEWVCEEIGEGRMLVKKAPKFKVGDVVRCIKDDELTKHEIYFDEYFDVVENDKYPPREEDIAVRLVNNCEDSFELVSRVIDGVTYTKKEIDKHTFSYYDKKIGWVNTINMDITIKEPTFVQYVEDRMKEEFEKPLIDKICLPTITGIDSKKLREWWKNLSDNIKLSAVIIEPHHLGGVYSKYLGRMVRKHDCHFSIDLATGEHICVTCAKPKVKKEKEMNKIIAEMYPKTKDAILVDKWFSSTLNSFVSNGNSIGVAFIKIMLKGKEEDLLNAAKELEAEDNKKG